MMIGIGQMMGAWSLWHWLVFAAVIAVILYPIGRILDRLGFSPFLSVVALVPLFNIIGLWLLATSEWPRDARSSDDTARR
jgi:hypothetical protein